MNKFGAFGCVLPVGDPPVEVSESRLDLTHRNGGPQETHIWWSGNWPSFTIRALRAAYESFKDYHPDNAPTFEEWMLKIYRVRVIP